MITIVGEVAEANVTQNGDTESSTNLKEAFEVKLYDRHGEYDADFVIGEPIMAKVRTNLNFISLRVPWSFLQLLSQIFT